VLQASNCWFCLKRCSIWRTWNDTELQWVHFVSATNERQGHTCVQVSSGCVRISCSAWECYLAPTNNNCASCAVQVSDRPTNCTSAGAWSSLLQPFQATGVWFSCNLHGLGTFNPLKTEFLLIYKNSVRTSQETHYVSTTKPNRLMLFMETVAVYCDNHTEHTDTLCGQNAEFVPYRKHITSPLQIPTS
jgi:hypothetical protein